MIQELVKKNRSYRRFYQNESISGETLKGLVNITRLTASGANLQPLKYIISNIEDRNEKIFKTLGWAGYLKDWNGPEEGEKPSAYILILNDTSISKNPSFDPGIAAQTILLAAVEKHLGGCMLANINREELKASLNIDDKYEIILALAIGKPKEEVVLELANSNGDIKYWRDENKVHHVPKRSLDEIILNI